jgi:hypothetical protein
MKDGGRKTRRKGTANDHVSPPTRALTAVRDACAVQKLKRRGDLCGDDGGHRLDHRQLLFGELAQVGLEAAPVAQIEDRNDRRRRLVLAEQVRDVRVRRARELPQDVHLALVLLLLFTRGSQEGLDSHLVATRHMLRLQNGRECARCDRSE